MDKTQLVKCTCNSSFQDEKYGNKMRVTTPNNKEQAKKFFIVRCTVCGKEHNLGTLK